MDPDLMRAMEEAWGRVKGKVMGDPDELAARLGRRRLGIMRRPHRAWCMGVRANDRRMISWNTVMMPQRPVVWDEEGQCTRYREHEVRLEKRLLCWLCRPVSIPFPGVESTKAAELLGVTPEAVMAAAKRGVFSLRYYKGLGGKRGKPVPVVSTRKLLDPGAFPLGAMAELEWGTQWAYLSERLPEGLCQTVVRRPRFKMAHGQKLFRGWRWVCPGCAKEVRLIYYPLPAVFRARFVERALGKMVDEGSADAVAEAPACFACEECHGIQRYGFVNGQGWGHLIAFASGGLLYGREVKKPEWFKLRRKAAYCAKPNRAPSKLGPRVMPLLANTSMTFAQMARMLKMTVGNVSKTASKIYRKHGVHKREELQKVLRAVEGAGMMAAG